MRLEVTHYRTPLMDVDPDRLPVAACRWIWVFIAWWLLVDFLSQHILVTIAITTVGPTTILSNLITLGQLIFIETGPVFWDLLHWGLE